MKTGSAAASILLILACAACAPLVAGQEPTPSPIIKDKKAFQPFLWLPIISDPGIASCWSSLESVGGCIAEITLSLISGHIGIGSSCCKAVEALESNCWSKMFSIFPIPGLDPFQIKNFCSS